LTELAPIKFKISFSQGGEARSSSRREEELDYLQPIKAPSYGKRRMNPEVELATKFQRVISDLIAMPQSYPFCRPVSSTDAHDYYDIIKNPKTLENIRDVCISFLFFH